MEADELALALSAAARATRQRRILVLSGASDWVHEAAAGLPGLLGTKKAIWLGNTPPSGWMLCAPHSARRLLGHEFDLICLDAFSGFDPDAFGIVSGTVTAGGLLCLLCPPFNDWPDYPDPERERIAVAGAQVRSARFLHRLIAILEAAPGVCLLAQGEGVRGDKGAGDVPAICSIAPIIAADGCVNPEQRAAVAAVLHAATGHRRRPVVLTAHRGRGKSAALGLAAAALLSSKEASIILTGPSLASVEPVFAHALARLPGAWRNRTELIFGSGRMRFVAPDALADAPPTADLVLVDEAAALPQALIKRFLATFPRMAFATSVHGYEGSGQAFALRFETYLNAEVPGWHNLTLNEPIRWSDGDPLEALSFRSLLLDAEPAAPDVLASQCLADVLIERLDRDALVANESLLGEIFGLLVLAHYRTRPFDLRQLLDGPTVSVWVARLSGRVLAVALLAAEGGLPQALETEVVRGRRRVRGHLLPQVLAAHCACPGFMPLSGWRVMRLAVHPTMQRQGLGSMLLSHLYEQARAHGLDWIGASFGATPGLLAFWRRGGFMPLRIGVTRESISGAHAALVLKPVSPEAITLHRSLRRRYLNLLPHVLSDSLNSLEPELVLALFARNAEDDPALKLPPELLGDVRDFAHGRREYEDALEGLWRLCVDVLPQMGCGVPGDNRPFDALVMKVLQKRSWAESAKRLGCPGRSQVVALLREAAAVFVD